MSDVTWRKSTRSRERDCVEIAAPKPGKVWVRDSKLGDNSPVLTFTTAAWSQVAQLPSRHQ
jgi:hypothetical protein